MKVWHACVTNEEAFKYLATTIQRLLYLYYKQIPTSDKSIHRLQWIFESKLKLLCYVLRMHESNRYTDEKGGKTSQALKDFLCYFVIILVVSCSWKLWSQALVWVLCKALWKRKIEDRLWQFWESTSTMSCWWRLSTKIWIVWLTARLQNFTKTQFYCESQSRRSGNLESLFHTFHD